MAAGVRPSGGPASPAVPEVGQLVRVRDWHWTVTNMPRVNLLIADDVGLGKTILMWQREMHDRLGYTESFTALLSESRRRQPRNRTSETASEFVTILLNKRLFSSPTAFYETLQQHMRTLHRSHAATTITEAQLRAEFTSVPPSAPTPRPTEQSHTLTNRRSHMRRRDFLSCALAVSATARASKAFARAPEQATSDTYDLLLKNGRLLDGGGNPWFTADIAVKNGKISKIGRLGQGNARRIIDLTGLFVSPGFIDIHSHSDTSMFVDRWIESKLRQGITTDVNGNCGGSPAPLNEKLKARAARGLQREKIDWTTMAEYFNRLERDRIALNMVMLVGHGTVRDYVMAGDHGAPTEKQLTEMKALVRQAMQQGAAGLSTGLAYSPGCYSHTDEVVELAKVAAEYGGIYASHLRDFASKVLGWSGEDGSVYHAVAEAIEIGKRSGVRVVQISHLAANSLHSRDPKLDAKVRDLIYNARKDGLDVLIDVLPTDWGSVAAWPARSVFGPPYFASGKEKLLERLRDPVQRAALKKELLTKNPAEMGFENTTTRLLLLKAGRGDGVWIFPPLNGHLKNPEYERKTLDVIARMKGLDLFDALFDLLVEENGNVCIANREMEGKMSQLTWSIAMPCTDGGSTARPGVATERVRPSTFSAFTDTLMWVRDKKLVALEDMIRRMTSLPAHALSLPDRGLIREGFQADITVFDLEKVRSLCTYENDATAAYPEGIPYVIINGVPVIDDNRLTKALPGAVLRRSSV
jgi:N-acyl-D-aspartate/D-glutamate deacylase